jgi:hypothetical protein
MEVEYGLDGCLVFIGQDKLFAMVGPAYWVGRGKQDFVAALQLQFEARKLEPRSNPRALYKMHRNVKV